jgi:type II secretory pathway pseudopilin PulG
MRHFRDRSAVCLIEILVALAVLALALAPVLGLFTSSQRTGHSAHRLLAAALHARALAETAAHLRPDELPLLDPGSELELPLDAHDDPPGGSGKDTDPTAGENGQTVPPVFNTLPRPAFVLARRLLLRRLVDGTLMTRAEADWESVPGDPASRQRIEMLAVGDPAPRAQR